MMLLLLAQPGATTQAPTARKGSDSFLRGAPFTYEQVVRFVREKAIPLRRQKEAIQNRGLDFEASADTLIKLEAAGASQDLLELIARVSRKPAAPALAATVPTDRLVPATNAGRILPADPPVATAPVAPSVAPQRPSKEQLGTELFRKMLVALGGQAAIPESLWFQAEGSVMVRANDGRNTRWNIIVRGKPGRALFQLMGGGAFHEISFDGSQFKTSKGLKGADARELPTNCGLILDHQIAGLVARLSAPGFKLSSGGDLVLIAESSTETVSINLDSDSRPAQVKFATATGLGSAIVTYSAYAQRGNVYFPQSVQIKPDSTAHGVDVRYDRVDLHPKLKDSDYNLNGKPLPALTR